MRRDAARCAERRRSHGRLRRGGAPPPPAAMSRSEGARHAARIEGRVRRGGGWEAGSEVLRQRRVVGKGVQKNALRRPPVAKPVVCPLKALL